MTSTNKTILAISGSLRENSYNTALLRNAAELNSNDVPISLYTDLHKLPNFDPLVAESELPDSVNDFRSQLQQADGVIFSTPEYAYGIPGVLKNALDWVVATGELVMKPTVAASVSTSELGGARAHYALITVLYAMNARMLVEASMNIPFARQKFTTDGILNDQLTKQAMQVSLKHLQQQVLLP